MTEALQSIDEGLAAMFAGDVSVVANPYPFYRRLREESPVHWFGASNVVVSSYPEVRASYFDAKRFRSSRQADSPDGPYPDTLSLLSEEERGFYREIIGILSLRMNETTNADDHRRVRSAAQPAFTPRRISQLGEFTQRLTDELLDDLAQDEQVDLFTLAYLVPLRVIMEILGASPEDADQMRRWGELMTYHLGRSRLDPERIRESHEGLLEYRAYVADLVERHRSEPGRSSLISAMLDAVDGERLTHDELVAQIMGLLFAGHETTAGLIGNGMLGLLEHRDQWELLCADPSLMSTAVDELLRYESPVQSMRRVTACDVSIAGVEVPAGVSVTLINGAANRDPQAFAEPDDLDLARRPNEHLAFGYGVHFCIGAPLARLEARIVLSTIARRFPEIELAVTPAELKWKGHPSLHSLEQLPVHLGPQARH